MSERIPMSDFNRIAEGLAYLRDIGMGNSADAIERAVERDERTRDDWMLCDCGARRPPDGSSCPACDDDAMTNCICVEFNIWSAR